MTEMNERFVELASLLKTRDFYENWNEKMVDPRWRMDGDKMDYAKKAHSIEKRWLN